MLKPSKQHDGEQDHFVQLVSGANQRGFSEKGQASKVQMGQSKTFAQRRSSISNMNLNSVHVLDARILDRESLIELLAIK